MSEAPLVAIEGAARPEARAPAVAPEGWPASAVAQRSAGATQAIERVLRAERDGQVRVERARQQAHAELEAARDEALAIVNRALDRIAGWQRRHARALEARLVVQRERAATTAAAQPPCEQRTIDAAVDHVAVALVGAADG